MEQEDLNFHLTGAVKIPGGHRFVALTLSLSYLFKTGFISLSGMSFQPQRSSMNMMTLLPLSPKAVLLISRNVMQSGARKKHTLQDRPQRLSDTRNIHIERPGPTETTLGNIHIMQVTQDVCCPIIC